MEDLSRLLTMRIPYWMSNFIREVGTTMDVSDSDFTRGVFCFGLLGCFKHMGLPVPSRVIELCGQMVASFPEQHKDYSVIFEEVVYQTRKLVELFPQYLKTKQPVPVKKQKRVVKKKP